MKAGLVQITALTQIMQIIYKFWPYLCARNQVAPKAKIEFSLTPYIKYPLTRFCLFAPVEFGFKNPYVPRFFFSG